MYIDVKVTTWERIEGIEMPFEKIVKLIKEKGIFEIFDMFPTWETITSSEEYLTPEENQGNPTIEIYEGDKMVWANI